MITHQLPTAGISCTDYIMVSTNRPSLIALFTAYTKANEAVADEAEEAEVSGILVPHLAQIPADTPEMAPCAGIILNAETSPRGSGSLEDGYWLRCRSDLKATAKAQKIYRL
jgi:hypothetical protein